MKFPLAGFVSARARMAVVTACCLLVGFVSFGADTARERLLLDFGWKFRLGDDWGTGEVLKKAGVSSGPASRLFSDASWRTLDLPHDWTPELPFDPHASTDHGSHTIGPGYRQNSVAWYRRAFALPKEDQGKRLWLEFDGVFRDCRVFLNGYAIGHHESGYSGFRYDITDVANCGGTNILAVRVDASEFEGWFYEGAGIYRHVWLVKTAPVAVAPDGVFVYSEFPGNVPQGPASLRIETTVDNHLTNTASVDVDCVVLDSEGKSVATSRHNGSAAPDSAVSVEQTTKVDAPALWSPETPNLYKLVTTVLVDGVAVDKVETEFGIRTVAFDVDQGFLLNGKHYEVKGTCNHQDHAGVGSALPDALQYFRVKRLKEMGDNGIRTSHNAPTPELLEACDRLGMLVMDENRLLGSDKQNLAYLGGLIKRDRNHPCVFVWSLFNEESQQTTATAARICATMQNLVKSLDPTRLCTAAGNVGNVYNGVNSVLDVRGWNYFPNTNDVDTYHKAHPTQPNIGTEQGSTVSTRGIYANDKVRGYVSAYDTNAPSWATTAEKWWSFYAARPWLSGGFVWTGFDYRGEPTPYGWPCISSHFGILDTCGFAKDNFYYYQAWWGDRTVLHILPHWTWPGREGQDIDVRCESNCEEVELFLNGKSLGRKPVPRNSEARWTVPYEAGTLLARGYAGGKEIAQDKVETTGPAAGVRLRPDRASINADGEDLAIVTVEVVDAQGRMAPTSTNMIDFDLSGPGAIAGVGNGDPSCHEPDLYVPTQTSRVMALHTWKMLKVPGYRNRPEVEPSFDDSQWQPGDADMDSGPLEVEECAVYRAHVAMTVREMLATRAVTIHIGSIDDEGWIYVNGRRVAESHDYEAQPTAEIRRELKEGDNVIAVVVKNNYGPGGLNKGVSLEFFADPQTPHWKRSVFNGLAQVLIRAGKNAGAIQLKASADGLASGDLQVTANAATPRPFVP